MFSPSSLACVKMRLIAFRFRKINFKPSMLQNIIYMAEHTFAHEHEVFHLQQTTCSQ